MSDLEIAKAEYQDAVELEQRFVNCDGDKMTIYEEDRLIIGHMLDFIQNNLELYADHIAKERKKMSNNNCKIGDVILDNYGSAFGFYDGMRKLFVDNVAEYIGSGDYERASEWCELLGDLDKYKESDAMLVATEHNGMGWTVDEYKGGENE